MTVTDTFVAYIFRFFSFRLSSHISTKNDFFFSYISVYYTRLLINYTYANPYTFPRAVIILYEWHCSYLCIPHFQNPRELLHNFLLFCSSCLYCYAIVIFTYKRHIIENMLYNHKIHNNSNDGRRVL